MSWAVEFNVANSKPDANTWSYDIGRRGFGNSGCRPAPMARRSCQPTQRPESPALSGHLVAGHPTCHGGHYLVVISVTSDSDSDAESAAPAIVVIEEPGDIDRLTFFTDAAVAISLTLLILPVSEYVTEKPDTSWSNLLLDNPEIIQSAVSFATIAVCWRYHHVLFERLRDYSRLMVWLNFFWLFCVVSIPVMTLAILPTDSPSLGDFRGFIDTLIIRGESNISYENYFVFWFVVGLSFFALYLVSRHAADPDRQLAKSGLKLKGDSWVYLRPTLVCVVAALLGLLNPAYGDLALLAGIVVSVIFARRSQRHREGA
ncbi:MAG: TMEM175 family protein [Candidatus Nanopelagicales bacterium]